MDELVTKIWSPELQQFIEVHGPTGKYVVEGVRYTVINGKVVTVTETNPSKPVVAGLKREKPRRWVF